jgi:hypothetical protein
MKGASITLTFLFLMGIVFAVLLARKIPLEGVLKKLVDVLVVTVFGISNFLGSPILSCSKFIPVFLILKF